VNKIKIFTHVWHIAKKKKIPHNAIGIANYKLFPLGKGEPKIYIRPSKW
jgi:hypothetical protein